MTVTHAELLTVVVPVREDAEHIPGGLASLLAQSGGAPSVIVVDDGSTDGSADAAREAVPGATILTAGGRGPSAARNVGVAAAAGATRPTTPTAGGDELDELEEVTSPKKRTALAVLASAT